MQISKLIKCSSCGKDIAIGAEKCPNCGAKNDWTHPAIAKLKDHTFSDIEFKCEYSGLKAVGVHEDPKKKHYESMMQLFVLWCVVSIPLSMFGKMTLALLGGVGSILFFGSFIFILISYEDKRFEADFSEGSLNWGSTDDEFWKPVKDLLMKSA